MSARKVVEGQASETGLNFMESRRKKPKANSSKALLEEAKPVQKAKSFKKLSDTQEEDVEEAAKRLDDLLRRMQAKWRRKIAQRRTKATVNERRRQLRLAVQR